METKVKNIKQNISQILSQFDHDGPGAAIGLIYNDQVIYKGGFGLAELEYEIPITNHTVFRIASVSKQFTGLCILILEEQSKLSLKDSLSNYFPEFPFEKVKIGHLLNHTSGIKDYLWLFNFAGYSFRSLDLIDEKIFFEMICEQKSLNFEPGERYLYSNSGYVLLAMLVERITGLTLNEFAQEHVFKPLKMYNTHFHDNYQLVVKNRAKAYTLDNKNNFIIYDTSSELVGDGAIFTTIEDMIRWVKNFKQNILCNNSTSLLEKLVTPGKLNSGELISYAAGLRLTNYKGLNQIYHAGMIAGFRSSFMIFPEEDLTVFCFSNYAIINPDEICHQITDFVLPDKITSSENDRTFDQMTHKQLLVNDFSTFSGLYQNREHMAIYEIKSKNNKLVCTLFAVDPLILYSRTEYRYDGIDTFYRNSGILEPRLTFYKDKNSNNYYFEAIENDGKVFRFDFFEIPEANSQNHIKYQGLYYSSEIDTYYSIIPEQNHLNVITKRIERISLKFQFIGDSNYTCNQKFITFFEDKTGHTGFTLTSYRIPKPILFVKQKILDE